MPPPAVAAPIQVARHGRERRRAPAEPVVIAPRAPSIPAPPSPKPRPSWSPKHPKPRTRTFRPHRFVLHAAPDDVNLNLPGSEAGAITRVFDYLNEHYANACVLALHRIHDSTSTSFSLGMNPSGQGVVVDLSYPSFLRIVFAHRAALPRVHRGFADPPRVFRASASTICRPA